MDKPDQKVKFVQPTNTLKSKVGSGGFDEKDIERAQDALDNTEVDFTPTGKQLLSRLQGTINDIKSGKITDGKHALDELIYPLLQLKAQGGMFNYPTITLITSEILLFLEDIKKIDRDLLKIMESYHKSASVILELSLRDIKSKVANEISNELSAVCARYTKKREGKK